MKFLIVGLGSMGRRRIRNLRHLGFNELAGYDIRADRRQEADLQPFASFEEALASFGPDAVLVCTPPDQHVQYALQAVAAGRHCFIEASCVDDGLAELEDAARQKPHLVVAPSCTTRHHPSILRMKALVDEGRAGRPLFFTYHGGQWLPDWHVYEDYRSYYVSNRRTGGCREGVPFELSWLVWIFGDLDSAVAIRDKVSDLDADIDDVYQILLRFKSGVLGHMLIDVVSRYAVRSFRLCSQDATIEWDAMARNVRLYEASTQQWVDMPEDEALRVAGYAYPDNMYVEEMKHFLAACKGEETWAYTLAEDRKLIQWLEVLEESSDKARFLSR